MPKLHLFSKLGTVLKFEFSWYLNHQFVLMLLEHICQNTQKFCFKLNKNLC